VEKRRREYSSQRMTERNIMCEIQRNSNAVAGLLPKVSLAKWSYLQLSYCVILYIEVLELVHNVAIVLFRWKNDIFSGYVV